MNETEFIQQLMLRIKAAEPLIWIDTPDNDWIIDSLKRDLESSKIHYSIIQKPPFNTFENSTAQHVYIWFDVSMRELDANAEDIYRHNGQLKTTATLIILTPLGQTRPQSLSKIPTLNAPMPSTDERKSLAKNALGKLAENTEKLDRIAFSSAGLTRTQLYRVLMRCSVEATNNPSFDDWERRIVDEKKQILAKDLSLEVMDDPASMDDVGGADELKLWIKQRTAVFSEDAKKFGLMPPRGLMLVGIQGCGKSLIAKAIANAWKFPLLKLDMSAIFADNSESPDAVLQRALQVADAMAPAVIWCDEIEKAFAEGSDPTTRRLLGHILNWLQERRANSFFVATANDVRELPSELIRKGRFDELFFIDLPDEKARADIFAIHLKKRNRNPKLFNCEQLAMKSQHFSGAEIEQAVISGLFSAFAHHREITQDDIIDAIQDTVPLYKQREDDIKHLREWATERTRSAANNARMLSYFN